MNEAGNELVLMFEDGDLTPHVDAVGTTREPEQRSKGVYFKVINRRYVAKRRRIDVRIMFLIPSFRMFIS